MLEAVMTGPNGHVSLFSLVLSIERCRTRRSELLCYAQHTYMHKCRRRRTEQKETFGCQGSHEEICLVKFACATDWAKDAWPAALHITLYLADSIRRVGMRHSVERHRIQYVVVKQHCCMLLTGLHACCLRGDFV